MVAPNVTIALLVLAVALADRVTVVLFETLWIVVPVENSVRFYLALRKAKVPAEMHIFENGPHGVGLALADPALSAWPTLLATWLRARGLLAR